MKKAVATLLLTSIVLSGVLVAIITGAYTKYSLEKAIEDNIAELQVKLEPVFVVFDKMVEREERRIQKNMIERLPEMHRALTNGRASVAEISNEDLTRMVEKYEFSEGYIINREGVIIQTTYSPDKNFNLNNISKSFSDFLTNIYGKGEVVTDRLTLSTKTGILNVYGYYSPPGSDSIVEASVNIREYMKSFSGAEYVTFVFQTLFESAMQSNAKVQDVDLFMYNELAAWSVLHEGHPLDNDVRTQLIEKPQVRIKLDNKLIVYSRFKPTLKKDLFTQDFCTKVVYDITDLNSVVLNFSIYAVICMILILPFVYLIVSKAISRRIVEPIGAIVTSLEAVKDGRYDIKLDIKSVSEVETIADAVNKMQGQIVRREQALEESNSMLERRVLERTKQLDQARQEAESLAHTDMLTGMPNRRSFYERAEEAFSVSKRYGRPLSAIVMDIDHFKIINDTYGHAVGDKILKEVAQAFFSASRDIDISGRVGGEEFALVLPETLETNAAAFAERLRGLISEIRISHEGTELSVTASFGVSRQDRQCETLDELLAHADLALYDAKESGRNTVKIYQNSGP